MARPTRKLVNHGLAFLGLLAFMVSFFGTRIFTTLRPSTWFVVRGIHLHHFWYGLVMVIVAGWLGIISTVPSHRRVYALLFGLGGGLIGDEMGLLLTMGDYWSQLTLPIGVGFIGLALLILLLLRYRERLTEDVLAVGKEERLIHVGVVVAGLSALAFSTDELLVGLVILGIGALMVLLGAYRERNRSKD